MAIVDDYAAIAADLRRLSAERGTDRGYGWAMMRAAG